MYTESTDGIFNHLILLDTSRMFDHIDEDFIAGDLTTVTYDIEENLEADNYEEQLSQLQVKMVIL